MKPQPATDALAQAEAAVIASALAMAAAINADAPARRLHAQLVAKETARSMVEAHDRDSFFAWLYRGSPERAWRIYSRVFRLRAYRTAQIVARVDERIAA